MVRMKKDSCIVLNQLEFRVFLGYGRTERAKKQTVKVDIHIQFTKPPKACTTDILSDTFCYDALNQSIKKNIEKKEFHLLEHLTYEIYSHSKTFLSVKNKMTVCVTKYPDAFFKSGGISFSYGDK
jgi:dihydroneopterin aldolase